MSALTPRTFSPAGAEPHAEPDAPTMLPPLSSMPLYVAEPGAGEPVDPTEAFEPEPPPPPPPPAPVGRPVPPDRLSEVAPAVSIAARKAFVPTVKAIHPPAGMTSLEVVAVTVAPPNVT